MLTDKIPLPNLRRQDTKNRQNSIDDVDPFVKQELEIAIERHFDSAMDLYQHMLSVGIAKECSRFVLPLAIPTKIYMSGSVRSWMHYIDLRSAHGTQKEHMDIAQQCRDVFVNELPICAEALEWT
jgi:thymidylate synthase (FAD)